MDGKRLWAIEDRLERDINYLYSVDVLIDFVWLIKETKELQEENKQLLEYKKAFEASKKAGVVLPYIKERI